MKRSEVFSLLFGAVVGGIVGVGATNVAFGTTLTESYVVERWALPAKIKHTDWAERTHFIRNLAPGESMTYTVTRDSTGSVVDTLEVYAPDSTGMVVWDDDSTLTEDGMATYRVYNFAEQGIFLHDTLYVDLPDSAAVRVELLNVNDWCNTTTEPRTAITMAVLNGQVEVVLPIDEMLGTWYLRAYAGSGVLGNFVRYVNGERK